MPAKGRMEAAWLVARPIAHRGLHDALQGIVENSLAAADAAITAGFAIECDIQRTLDDEAVVFHDFTLDRLMPAKGRVDAMPVRALTALAFQASPQSIPTFAGLLGRIAGRVPLICEIKSRFDGDTRLAKRAWQIARTYDGPLAFKSFDPEVMAWLRETVPPKSGIPLGVVAETIYDDPEWEFLSSDQKKYLANFLHLQKTEPDFLSYFVNDLLTAVPYLCRHGIGMPVMAWTIRTENQRRLALAAADQIVFEGLRP